MRNLPSDPDARKRSRLREIHRSQVRLPTELATWLRSQADDNFRSMNAEIVQRLKQSRAQQTKDDEQ